MKKALLTILTLFTIFGWSQTLDQNNSTGIPQNTYNINNSYYYAQSFTAGMSGNLAQIGLLLRNNSSSNVPLRLTIYSGDGFAVELNNTDYTLNPNSSLEEKVISLTGNVSIVAGNIYTIKIAGLSNQIATTTGVYASNTYPNGGFYYIQQTFYYATQDMWFKTYVTVPPSAPTVSAQSFCFYNNPVVGNLNATGETNATFNWYNVATGGSVLDPSTNLATGTYYVSQTVNGIESSRTSVPVTVTQVSANYTNNGYIFTFNQAGATYEWYGVNSSYPTLLGTSQSIDLSSYNYTHYFGSVTLNGCTVNTLNDIYPSGILGSTDATNAGNGSASQSVLPILFGSSKTQYLFTEADLDAAGIPDGAMITQISWYVITDNTPTPITFDAYAEPNFDTSNLATGAAFSPTPAQQIMNMKIDSQNISNGWHTFYLDSQFAKVQGKSLLLQFCRISGSQPQEDVVHINNTSYNSAITGYFNHACTDSNGDYTNTFRPTFKFSYNMAALSAEDFEFNTKLSVYPNPSNGIYNLEIDDNATVEVYDVVGKKLLNKTITIGTSQLDLSNFNTGMYILNVTNSNNQTKTVKLIQQ